MDSAESMPCETDTFLERSQKTNLSRAHLWSWLAQVLTFLISILLLAWTTSRVQRDSTACLERESFYCELKLKSTDPR